MRQYLGSELLSEYEGHFADLKAKGRINKLENIAVRKVEIVDSGMMDGEEFIIVRFTANLLDYTVDEASGKVLEGDSSEPVKFDEKWAFARQEGNLCLETGGNRELELLSRHAVRQGDLLEHVHQPGSKGVDRLNGQISVGRFIEKDIEA